MQALLTRFEHAGAFHSPSQELQNHGQEIVAVETAVAAVWMMYLDALLQSFRVSCPDQ